MTTPIYPGRSHDQCEVAAWGHINRCVCVPQLMIARGACQNYVDIQLPVVVRYVHSSTRSKGGCKADSDEGSTSLLIRMTPHGPIWELVSPRFGPHLCTYIPVKQPAHLFCSPYFQQCFSVPLICLCKTLTKFSPISLHLELSSHR